MSSNIKIQRICQHCNSEFAARTTVTKYCSLSCAQKNYKLRKRNEKIKVSNEETLTFKLQPIEILKEKEFLSVEETGVLLGVSKRTLYRLIKQKSINIGKFGRRTIIKRSEIDKFFES
jgi:excisionase family DNA binding protein